MDKKSADKLVQKYTKVFGAMPEKNADGGSYIDLHTLGIVEPGLAAARTASIMAHGGIEGTDTAKELEIQEAIERKLKSGDILEMSVEALFNQFIVLDSAFNHYAQISAVSKNLEHKQICLDMALKAQDQARKTLETINTIKNPQPKAVYIKQAIAQQVNQLLVKTEELQKKIEAQPYAQMDFRGERETTVMDVGEPALDEINRSQDRSRKTEI